MTLDPNHVNWCKQLFNSLTDGGVWAVPRSGVVFTRRGDRLVLTAAMPHDPAMPIDADQLRRQQDGDFNAIQQHFGAAGITVEREIT